MELLKNILNVVHFIAFTLMFLNSENEGQMQVYTMSLIKKRSSLIMVVWNS